MRKCSFEKNHREFEGWIRWYGQFISKLVLAKHVVRTKLQKLELMEALVLRCVVRWEVLVEQDIVASLNRDTSTYSAQTGLSLRKHLTRDECEAILVGHRYVDFRNVGAVKDFGKHYLSPKYDPFSAIPSKLATRIDDFICMRNLLAHYSKLAARTYQNRLAKRFSLRRIPEPGEFLNAVNPKSGMFRRDEYLHAFVETSELMVKAVT